jgi:replicative DNA helicase
MPSPTHPDIAVPSSPDAEEAVIGALLLDGGALPGVSGLVAPEDFHSLRLGWLFEAIRDLYERGISPDFLTVCQALEQRGRLAESGGAGYVTLLAARTPSAIHAESYARVVADMAYRRRLIEAAQRIARLAHSETTSLVEIHDQSTEALEQVAGRAIRVHHSARQLFGRELDDLLERIREAREGHPRTGWSAGINEWDAIFEGEFRPGSYSVLFGPTGVGKTWALLQMALAASRQGPVVFISLENLEESIRARMVALEAGVPFGRVRRGDLDDVELAACVRSLGALAERKLELVTHLNSVGEIAAHLQAATVRLGGVGLAFVDTLNELADTQLRDTRYENLTRASARLLAAMRSTGWGIVAAAQQRNDLTPGMDAEGARVRAYPVKRGLEGSRSIVQHVSTLIGMYSPDAVARDTANPKFIDSRCPRGQVMFVNVKSRDARGSGDATVVWNGRIPCFEGKEPSPQPLSPKGARGNRQEIIQI